MQIQKDYVISLFLDTRRQKKQSKLYPVKLRVFCSQTRKAKLYSTKFEFESEKLFESVYKTEKPRKIHEEQRLEMQAVINTSNEAAKSLSTFTFEGFEKAMKITGKGRNDVFLFYEQAINEYRKEGRIGTASNYDLSAKSLKLFSKKETLNFAEVTPKWLKAYENHMLTEKKSPTTVGIYLRPLRAVFNTAIAEKAINADLYPFGKRKYVIPQPNGTKRALDKEQLKVLWEAKPQTPEQEQAKDFFFLSYQMNGLNFADICYLKFSNISGDKLSFHRRKTQHTNKDQAPVTIFLTDFALQVIAKYGNKQQNPDSLIFPFISEKADPELRHRQIINFISRTNQQLRKFAKANGIEVDISTYFARHSFATISIRAGFSMEAVSEGLGHSSISTTKAYFAGFDDTHKKALAESLMNFNNPQSKEKDNENTQRL